MSFQQATCVKLSVLLVFIAMGIALQAQIKINYEGPYQLAGGQNGIATYQYAVSNKDTLKQGNFRFHSVSADSSVSSSFNFLSYQGAYDKNRKQGKWLFSFKNLEPSEQFHERDYQLVQPTNGREFLINANFKYGKANGNWDITEQNIINSHADSPLIFVEATFQAGVLVGKIRGKYEGITFSGNVNQQGFIDGEWVFTFLMKNEKTIEEKRFFDNGTLLQHYLKIDADTVYLRYAGIGGKETLSEDDEWGSLEINEKYFDIIQNAYTGVDPPENHTGSVAIDDDFAFYFTNNSNELLERVLQSFIHYKGLHFWILTGGSDAIVPTAARMRKYPMSDMEKKNLKEALQISAKTKERFASIFDDANLELDRYGNQKLMRYYELLRIHEKRIEILSGVANKFLSPPFEYIDRKKIFNYLLSGLTYPEFISYEFNDEAYTETISFPVFTRGDQSDSQLVEDYLEIVLAEIEKIEDEIDKILQNKLKEVRLQEKEKLFVKGRDTVLANYENVNDDEDFNKYHQLVAEQVTAYVRSMFKNYAVLETSQKADTVDALLYCLDSFVKLFEAQKTIPVKLKRLDEAYTRTVWNPYMMTNMTERVKERVYNAFETHLMPYYLGDVKASLTCGDIDDKAKNFEAIYSTLMRLREVDTREIERSLRNVNSPTRILEILSIDLQNNDNE